MQNNVEETHNKNSSLIDREQIENTPFYLIGNEEKGYFIAMGKYRLTEPTKTKEESIIQLEQEKWNIIIRIVDAIITITDNEIQNLQSENK